MTNYLNQISGAIFIVFISICSADVNAQELKGEQLAEAILYRYQPHINTMTNKGWDHSNSIVLHAMEKLYAQNHKVEYLDYIQRFVDEFVKPDGTLVEMHTELDGIHPAVLCLFLYQETGEEKYKVAAKNMRDFPLGEEGSPSVFQQTPEGGFWHKNNDHYNQVMTVDGVYMANPFLVKYGMMFNDSIAINTATFQTLLVSSHTWNLESHLPYHGWDSSHEKSWANPITGTSSEVWSRCVGWYIMALVDMLAELPETHQDYADLLYLYQQLAVGVKDNQMSDGLWCQMVNRPEAKGNYPETSGSGMIIYGLQKGVDKGWLDPSYQQVADRAWGALQNYLVSYKDGYLQVTSFNPGMGIKDNQEEYLKVRPTVCPSDEKKQHPHGYCAVLMAASEMEY
ncbi:glycoside hydrolase family 88/105 protein [Reichenbachiella ulvae]|uniref:Glycoside hydrolase family 88 protein n=1 Tax=Reichenbachiella ulvae TaxID=2980104 RepID=A0ABT3CNY4_9BACT|nr:glycoside hydrolase family 88 protein [Reichenbachiella ulvae]MCV9385401.1 glycoside hydrolase family 88 protein [Reichenbachiella ulvae]